MSNVCETSLKQRLRFLVATLCRNDTDRGFGLADPAPTAAIHLQKVMLKRNPAPFEQQRVSVPIEEQEQICFANRQYRQQLVVSSTAEGCASRDATRRCCQSGRHKRQESDKRGIFAEFPSRGVSDLLNPCAGSFWCFLRLKST